jgi:RNA polymerase sigma-70 factor (ECF subfamily)
VVNTALKKYTVSRYQKEISGYEVKESTKLSAEPPVFSSLSQKELLHLINNLPDGYRLIFNLHVIEGYQHEEIAVMLHIQPGTSRSQLVKARSLLQKQINELQKISI